jgi:hypothetical protein
MAKKKVTKKITGTRKTSPKKKSSRTSSTIIKIPQVPLRQRLDPYALAYALAGIRVIILLIISIVKNPGLVQFAESIHFTYSLSFSGIITGIAETAIWGLVMGFIIGWLYNRFV